jgi:P27 family predicted phage terminase small subunit
MRGRRAQPEGIKEQKVAVRSKRSKSAAAPVAPLPAGAIAAPHWLVKEGLAIWKKLEPTLRSAKLLTATDADVFARYCRNFARWLKMQREMDKQGETYESDSAHGKLRRITPAFMIADRLERQLLATEDRFGINPAARQTIMVARARTGAGDLFQPDQRPGAAQPTPAATPAQPAATQAPIGFLQ